MGEDALRERLREVADRASDGADYYDALWQRALRSRRTHRRVVVAVAVASVVCAASLVALGPRLLGSSAGPTDGDPDRVATSPAGPDTAGLNPAGRWVAGMPLGTPPSRPYVSGSGLNRTLHHNGEETVLAGLPYTVLDAVPGGFLVRADAPGRGYGSRYGVLGPDGTVAWIGRGRAEQARLSTDHTRLAVVSPAGIDVYHVESRVLVASMQPADEIDLWQYVDTGVVYGTFTGSLSSGGPFLWKPGTTRTMVPLTSETFTSGVVSEGHDRAVLDEPKSTCSVAVESDGETDRTLFKDCGLARPYTISPDGEHALTVDLRVVDLDSGTATHFDGAPHNSGQMPPAVWEDDTHVLLSLRMEGVVNADRAIVRCSVVALECERLVEGRTIWLLDATRETWW